MIVSDMMMYDGDEFNNKNNELKHTLNFINIAFTEQLPISSGASSMNKCLTDFLEIAPSPNEWFVLDFPSIDVIRAIYNSNFGDNKPVYKYNTPMNLDLIHQDKSSAAEKIFYMFQYFIYKMWFWFIKFSWWN